MTSNGSSYFGFGVFEELDEGGNQVAADNLIVDSLGDLKDSQKHNSNQDMGSKTDLLKLLCNHVAYSPALVLEEASQGGKKDTMARLLLLGNGFGNGDKNLDSQKTNTVLVVAGEMLEQRNHLVNDDVRWHDAQELGQVDGGLSPDHGGIIVDEQRETLPQGLLCLGVGLGVGDLVDASGRDLCSEPVGF